MPSLDKSIVLGTNYGIIRKFDTLTNTFSANKFTGEPYEPIFCTSGDAAGNIMYAGGGGDYYSILVKSIDGGESWDRLTPPQNTWITAIHFISPTEIYFFHSNPTGKLYRYDGSAFTQADFVHANSRVWAIWGTSNNLYTGWYYNEDTSFAIRWWNGSSWQTDYSINGGAELRVYGGALLNDGESLVVGVSPGGGRKFYKGTFENWVLEKNAEWEGTLQDIFCENLIAINPVTGTAFILNANPYSPNGFYLYKRTAAGVYTTHQYESPDGAVGSGIAVIDDNNVFIACGNFAVVKFDGTSFTRYATADGYSARTIWAVSDTDVDPPTFESKFPSASSTDAAKDTVISVSIRDTAGSGVDSATIDATVTINGSLYDAIINGVFQTPFSGTITANAYDGYDVSISRASNYLPNASITAYVYAEDTAGNHADVSWSFQIGAYAEIASVQPTMISMVGGEVLTFTGIFSPDAAYQVFMGPSGLSSEAPCYSGISGQGLICYSNAAGTELQCVAPAIQNGSPSAQVILVHRILAGEADDTIGITIVEAPFKTVLFNARQSFPPWAAVGPRRLDLESEMNLT